MSTQLIKFTYLYFSTQLMTYGVQIQIWILTFFFFSSSFSSSLWHWQEFEKRNKKEKNRKLRHGESNNSFIPLFREPSSVEKIFLDFEREQQRVTFRPSSPPTPPFVTPRHASPRALSPRISSARPASLPVSPPRVVNRPKGFRFRPEPTLRNHHASATKIQSAYRGYVVSFVLQTYIKSFGPYVECSVW